MQKTYPTQFKQDEEMEAIVSHFPLPGLLPIGHILALNLETHTLSLISNGPVLIKEQRFSVNEMSVLTAILNSFPHYCPYEVLLSYVYSNIVTESSIMRCRKRLQEAQLCGMWKQELRPIRRTLSSLRSKLHHFNLGISNVREMGCNLTSLASPFQY